MSNALFGRMPFQHLSLDKMIQFGDHLFVDHPVIDAQHKAIFNLGIDVYEKWRGGGNIDVLRPAVEKLSNLMHSHFSFEERVLHEIGYDDLKNHAAEHRSMRDELSIMHERLHNFKETKEIRGGSLLAPGWSIMQFILGFTVGHVASSDMAYNRALVANRHLISAS
jgi:hemerythrin-like metal-binding protein